MTKPLLLVSFLLITLHAVGDEITGQSPVRNAVDTPSPVWVGQKIEFHIDLLSPTFFSGTAKFDLPTLDGVILMKMEGRPTVSSEKIDGESYSVQRHRFAVFSQRAGVVEVPAFSVRFATAPAFGEPPEEQSGSTDLMSFEVRSPPGTERLAVVASTSEFTVAETWTPALGDEETRQARVGDAFVRRITMRARDIPAMVMPAVTVGDIEGVGIYPHPPVLNDSMERGTFTGERVEETTFVCEQPGSIVLPALNFSWWDTQTEVLQRIELPAVALEVAPGPVVADEEGIEAPATTPSSGQRWIWLVLVVAAIGGTIWWRIDSWHAAWSQWRQHRHDSESGYFGRLARACRAGNPAAIWHTLTAWLDRQSDEARTMSVEEWIAQYPDRLLADEIGRLQEVLVQGGRTFDGTGMLRLLRAHRRARRRLKWTLPGTASLPPLNPARTTREG